MSGSPGRLRIWTAVTIVAVLLFGGAGASSINSRARALSAARASAEQLVRLQTVRTRLVQADADAANAFLVGGLEPAERRASYVDAIAAASAAIPTAAGRDDDDAAVLAEVNDSLSRYTGLVEAARANNRQGLAVGATYLQQASALLRAEILPKLTELVSANQDRVQAQYDRSADAGAGLALVVVIALVALAIAQVVIASMTRRVVNTGLAGATAVVLIAGVVAGSVMLYSQVRANRAHTRAYAATVELAQARIDGFDAKSAESLTLVARGSGAAYDDEFARVAADAKVQLAAALDITDDVTPAFNALLSYIDAHAAIRAADTSGDFEKAVKLATADNAGTRAFAEFDKRSASVLDEQSDRIVDELRGSRAPLRPVAVLMLAAGLLAAYLARRGIAERLLEYR